MCEAGAGLKINCLGKRSRWCKFLALRPGLVQLKLVWVVAKSKLRGFHWWGFQGRVCHLGNNDLIGHILVWISVWARRSPLAIRCGDRYRQRYRCALKSCDHEGARICAQEARWGVGGLLQKWSLYIFPRLAPESLLGNLGWMAGVVGFCPVKFAPMVISSDGGVQLVAGLCLSGEVLMAA